MTVICLLKRAASAVMCRVCRQLLQPAASSISHVCCQRGYSALHKQSQAYTSIVLQPGIAQVRFAPSAPTSLPFSLRTNAHNYGTASKTR